MAFMDHQYAISAYSETETFGQVDQASGHELIQLLLNTLSLRIAEAVKCIEKKDINEKITRVNKALNIIDGLRASLNEKDGGEIATNLDDLYDYMQRRLVEANARNDIEIFYEIKGLVDEIKDAWAQIPLDVR